MSDKERPQKLKTAKTVEIKTALPWTIIVLLAVAGAAFIWGWTERSNQMITRSEVTAEVMQQLSVESKKADK